MQREMETHRSFDTEVLDPNNVRVLIPYDPELAHYNAAVLGGNTSDALFILAREVPLANVRAGIPDKGVLVVYRSNLNEVKKIGKLDLSNPKVINWEDPRAYTAGKDVFMGLTAIRASDNKPVAATVRGRIIEDGFKIDPESLTVCLNDEGKNTTPISVNRFLFRRNGSPHLLEVAQAVKDGTTERDRLEVIKTIKFPKKSWCEYTMGTTAQMLPGGILPIHGVNRYSIGINSETGFEEHHYTYSIGLAQLDENMNVIKVSDAPIFTRDSFKNILPMGQEMDTNKDVVYCCGYLFNGETVKFVINIGDLMTVEVTKEFSELKDMLELAKPIIQEELEAA